MKLNRNDNHILKINEKDLCCGSFNLIFFCKKNNKQSLQTINCGTFYIFINKTKRKNNWKLTIYRIVS